jgi:hypothetical protein
MNSQAESQLSDDLQRLVAAQPFVPDIAAIERRGRQARRRTAALRGAAGLGAAGLGAAGGITAVALVVSGVGGAPAVPGGSTAAGGGAAGAAASKPPVQTAAYVSAQVEAALAQADKYIIRTTTNSYAGGTYTNWTDPRTGSSYASQGTGSGRVLSWGSSYLVQDVLHWSTTEADYSSHTWFVSVIHAAGPIVSPMPTGPDVPGGSPAQLKKGLATGVYKIVGHGHVNGHRAIELRAGRRPLVMTVWVDAQTYQPVRLIKTFTFGQKDDSLSFDESWVPRSAALVKIANHPEIPAGFTRVAAPQ